MKNRGVVFNIQRFSVHDGPGIRTTVFLKGCFLRCPWCHNPEGINPYPELVYRKELCSNSCNECLYVCPLKVDPRKELRMLNNSRCIVNCRRCVDICPTRAIDVIGREMEIQEVLNEVMKDNVFYEVSNGGVTISGGEPLLQGEFTLFLVEALKAANLHVVVETCGFGNSQLISNLIQSVDMVILDIKYGLPEEYEKNVGVKNGKMLFRNLEMIFYSEVKKVIRFPCIPGYTDSMENILAICDLLQRYKIVNIARVEILPYNRLGICKYVWLGYEEPVVQQDYKVSLSEVCRLLEKSTGGSCVVY